MQLKKYIKGNRRGKEANRLEREAMNDPFLQDALDGFDAVPGNHAEIIERLSLKVQASQKDQSSITPSPISSISSLFIAATILLLIGFGAYFLLERNDDPYLSAFMTVQSKELPSEPVKESDAQTMEKLTESEYADQAAAVASSRAITNQRESSPAARATMPANTQDLSAQKEYRHAAPSTPSQTEAQRPPALVARQEVAEINMDSYVFMAEISDDELEEDAIFTPLDSDEINLSDTNRIIPLEEDAQLLSEVVIVGYGVQKKNILTRDNAKRYASNTKFGEKEFQKYCRQKADKNACEGKKVSVRVSFFIDESGKPVQIKYERFTCEKAKDEIERLLSASPVWTNINRKVTITIRW